MAANTHGNFPKVEEASAYTRPSRTTVVNVLTTNRTIDVDVVHHHEDVIAPPPANSSHDINSMVVYDMNANIYGGEQSNENNGIVEVDEEEEYNNDAIDRDKPYFDEFPPGYRFCPSDNELIIHYLRKKILNQPLPKNQIRDVNLYRNNPDYISGRYPSIGDNQWFFFTPREKKYMNGTRPNRAAGSGYWKATGADKNIFFNGDIVGVRKALVFYEGRPPKGVKTNWIMHEYRTELGNHKKKGPTDMRLDDYVLCKIYQKNQVSPKGGRQRDDDENADNEPVQQHNDELLGDDQLIKEEDRSLFEDKNLFDPSCSGGIQQIGNPYDQYNQANYACHESFGSMHQYQLPMLIPMGTATATQGNPLFESYQQEFTPLMHSEGFLYPQTPMVNGMVNALEDMDALIPRSVDDMAALNSLIMPMNIDPTYLMNLDKHGIDGHSMPQDSHHSRF